MWGIFPIFLFFTFSSLMAQAHPVTYKDGVMLKTLFREDMSENSLTYSFHSRLAVGLDYTWLRLQDQDTHWYLTEFNALLKRWNGDHSQANIYAITGAGYSSSDQGDSAAGKVGMQVDYETRRFYTMAQYNRWFSEDFESDYYVYRLGFAPFVAGYEDLNTWFIVQTDYNRDMRKNVQVTPMLRFFFKNVLWEFGASTQGNFFGQIMVHL